MLQSHLVSIFHWAIRQETSDPPPLHPFSDDPVARGLRSPDARQCRHVHFKISRIVNASEGANYQPLVALRSNNFRVQVAGGSGRRLEGANEEETMEETSRKKRAKSNGSGVNLSRPFKTFLLQNSKAQTCYVRDEEGRGS